MLRISKTLRLPCGVLHSTVSNAYMSTISDLPRIAVVLSGCGVNDGTEIHEAVHTLAHITRNGGYPILFAPDMKQFDIIDHKTGTVDKTHTRGVLVESARIARGNVKPLSDLVSQISNIHAVIFPGGFGVAKNLSDFATSGANLKVHPDVVKVIEKTHKKKKPLGFMCIAPILAAKVLCNVTITLGMESPASLWPHHSAIQVARNLGAILEAKGVNEISIDRENLIFSTPAYMYNGKFHEIDDGVGILVKYILTILQKGL